MRSRFAAVLSQTIIAAAWLSGTRGDAQVLRVRAVETGTARPVAGAIVSVLDSLGRPLARGLTNETGRLILRAPRPGIYRLRADRIGYPGTLTDPVHVMDSVSVTVVMPLGRVTLPELTAVGETECSSEPGNGQVAVLWQEARKGLLTNELTTAARRSLLAVRKFRRRRQVSGALLSDSTVAQFVTDASPFVSEPPRSLFEHGFIQEIGGTYRFYAPDASALLSDEFLEAHCFAPARGGPSRPGLVGLAFDPIHDRNVPEVRGTVWLDRGSAEVREIEFEYVDAPRPVRFRGIGGRIAFVRLATGALEVSDWYVRVPERVRERTLFEERVRVAGYLDEGGTVRVVGDASVFLAEQVPHVSRSTVELIEVTVRVADPDTTPVTGARVAIAGIDSTFATDASGYVRLTLALREPLRLRVTAVGFQPVDARLTLAGRGREFDTTLVLRRQAQLLAPIDVTGEGPRPIGKLLDFERRRRMGFGSFLTRADLASWEGLPLSTALRTLRATILIPRAIPCGGGFAAASTRSFVRAPCLVMPGCPLAVYVDGVRIYDPTSADAPPDVDQFLTQRVEALELYRGPGEAPIEFVGTGNSCGALVIWTRISSSPD